MEQFIPCNVPKCWCKWYLQFTHHIRNSSFQSPEMHKNGTTVTISHTHIHNSVDRHSRWLALSHRLLHNKIYGRKFEYINSKCHKCQSMWLMLVNKLRCNRIVLFHYKRARAATPLIHLNIRIGTVNRYIRSLCNKFEILRFNFIAPVNLSKIWIHCKTCRTEMKMNWAGSGAVRTENEIEWFWWINAHFSMWKFDAIDNVSS